MRLPSSSSDILGKVFSTENITFTLTQMAEKSAKNLNWCVISLVGTLSRVGKTEQSDNKYPLLILLFKGKHFGSIPGLSQAWAGEKSMQKIPDTCKSTLKCHCNPIMLRNSEYGNSISDLITVLVITMISL